MLSAKISNLQWPERLAIPQGRLNIVLDTDTYNEIDEQFALSYAMLSPERLNVQAIYAKPFSNNRSTGPDDGMEKSYEEILRVLGRLGVVPAGLVYKGSTRYLVNKETPCSTDAALDLVERAIAVTEPIFVVAIGAITNIASAILVNPGIIDIIVIVWLGGNAYWWPDNQEFNLKQDVFAASLVFDCGVPLIHVPCMNVASHMIASPQEVDHFISGKSTIGDYLAGIFRMYCDEYNMIAKEIWDISAVAVLLNSDWVQSDIVHSPIVSEKLTWSFDPRRHLIKSVRRLNRNAIFKDMYDKISNQKPLPK